MLVGEAAKLVRLLEGGGNGLLDEQVQARAEKAGSYVEVGRCGHTDRSGVEWNGCKALVDCGEDGDTCLGGKRGGLTGIRLDNGRQDNRESGDLEVPVDADVVAAKSACAADGNSKWVTNGQE